MKILKYESEQYAGVRNQSVTFTEGINVVLGDNETGKSTMITGIYETLLRNSKINLRNAVEKAFSEKSFPAGGGNSIDGNILLAIGEDEIEIKKEWNRDKADSRTIFKNSSGRYTGTEAEEKIREILNYGEAIYNHIVFGRQNNETAILDWFYSFIDMKKTQGDGIAEARKKISEAFSAAGGISEDLYLEKLRERIKQLENHWDLSSDAPQKDSKKESRGISNPWTKEVGEILEAYYALKNHEEILKNEKELIASLAEDEINLQEKKNQKSALEGQLQELNQLKSTVETKTLQSNSKNECIRNLNRFQEAEDKWPKLKTDKENIEKLLEENEEQEKRIRKQELEKNVRKLHILKEQREAVQVDIDGMEKIEEDNRTCQKLLDQIEGIQLKLSSTKLHAQITMLSDYVAQMTTADGETIHIDEQYDAPVNGFAKIQIPGIAEIMVAPQELDVAGLQKQIGEKQDELQGFFDKYKVVDKAMLNQKCKTYQTNKSSLSDLDNEIGKLLDGKSMEALEEELQDIQINEAISVRENLIDEVRAVLLKYDTKTLDGCKTAVRVQIDTYESDYETDAKLEEMIANEEQKLDNAEKALKKLESISWTKEDFDEELKKIQRELNGRDGKSGLNHEIEDLIAEIATKSQDIEDIDLDAREQEVKDLERILEQKKKLHRQYSRIKADFESLKEKQGNKSDAFYNQFNKYLSIITEDKVRIENGKIRSDINELNSKELLSRGTKQTLLLAFRLALLEYYYQDDGGVMILDDVLLDMDPKRRKQSVKLLQKFAEKNQVIFTTCDPVIADMFRVKPIELKNNQTK